jgi:O-antigen biosynthesis protein
MNWTARSAAEAPAARHWTAGPWSSSDPETDAVVFEAVAHPVVTVVVLGWWSAPHLVRCLRSVSLADRSVPFEVVVALNDPTQELADTLTRLVHGARIHRSRVNLGFGGGCNAAVAVARGRHIAFLNDDSVVDRYWLRHLVDAMESDDRVSAVGSQLLNTDGTVQESGSLLWSDGSTSNVTPNESTSGDAFDWARQVDYCSAASLLVRKSTWDRLDGFDEAFYPAYYEDVDLCLRIKDIGRQVWFQPLSKVAHVQGASTGDRYRSFLYERNRKVLIRRWSHVLNRRLRPAYADESAQALSVWLAMGCPSRVLVIDDRIPKGWIGSGYGRMLDAVRDMASSGRHFVSFWPREDDGGSRADLSGQGIRIVRGDLEDHLRQPQTRYDVVVVSRPHNYELFGNIVRKLQPRAVLVYDSEALYFRREDGRRRVLEAARGSLTWAEPRVTRAVEERIFGDADHIVCISEDEADIVKSLRVAAPVHVVPAHRAVPSPTYRAADERRDALFVAGWLGGDDSPNLDGLTWFLERIMPLVWERVPWLRLRITGVNPPQRARRFSNLNIVFEGYVHDLYSLYDQVRLVVVPIRFGAGVKLKTVEALTYAVPTVSTSSGAEGIDLQDTEALLIADEPDPFARHVVALATNVDAWETQRDRIRTLIASWGSSTTRSATWTSVIDQALAGRRRGSLRSAGPFELALGSSR